MKNEEIVKIEDVSFHYGNRNALDHVSLTIKKGSFLGLIGPNGSGKSTLIRLLLGLEPLQSGKITIFNESIERFHQWEKIGFVSQKANSFNSGFPATVYEVVSMGLYGKVGLFRFLNHSHKKKIHAVIEQVGMTDYLHQNIGELSGGQQQRVFIARALVSDPQLLILDEPTVGVDLENVHYFYDLLTQLNKQKGMTMLMVSHDIATMINHVTDVACLNKNLHFHGDREDFIADHKLSSFHGSDVHLLSHHHSDGGH